MKPRKFPIEKVVTLFSRCETCEQRYQMAHAQQRRCGSCIEASQPKAKRCTWGDCRGKALVESPDRYRFAFCQKHAYEVELVRQRTEGFAELEAEGMDWSQQKQWLGSE